MQEALWGVNGLDEICITGGKPLQGKISVQGSKNAALPMICLLYTSQDLHERERDIKAARGKILDAKGKVLADNKTVCTVSVIHSQIKEPEKVIRLLVSELGITEAEARKKVEKVSSIERIRTNVDKETGDAIRRAGLFGVKVDEDYKRYYPFGTLASHVLGFTGGDNQGIIGLEVEYEEDLKGTPVSYTHLDVYKRQGFGSVAGN